MATKLYDACKTRVVEKLKTINKAAGYSCEPTILEGWLKYYAADIINGVNGLSFPIVCVQYDSDKNNQNKGGALDSTCVRTITVNGAVTTDDPYTINEKLDDLLFDVKRSLANESRNLTITDVGFMLPESGEPYAMFVVTVLVTVVENWTN